MSTLKGRAFEDYVINNMPRLFPDLNFVSKHGQLEDKGFDIHAKDSNGVDYFIEIKSTECNRLNIGQIIEYKAELAKNLPEAKIILICKKVDSSIKDLVKKIGVDIRTFPDLGIIQSDIVDREKEEIMKLSPVEQRAYFALLKRGSIMAKTEDLSSVLSISAARAKNIFSKLARKWGCSESR